MPDDLESVRVLVGHDAQTGVTIDELGRIHQYSIDLARKRRLGKTRPNARGDLRHGNRMIELSLASVRKSDYGHTAILSTNTAGRRPQGRHPAMGMVRASGIEPLTPTMSR